MTIAKMSARVRARKGEERWEKSIDMEFGGSSEGMGGWWGGWKAAFMRAGVCTSMGVGGCERAGEGELAVQQLKAGTTAPVALWSSPDP